MTADLIMTIPKDSIMVTCKISYDRHIIQKTITSEDGTVKVKVYKVFPEMLHWIEHDQQMNYVHDGIEVDPECLERIDDLFVKARTELYLLFSKLVKKEFALEVGSIVGLKVNEYHKEVNRVLSFTSPENISSDHILVSYNALGTREKKDHDIIIQYKAEYPERSYCFDDPEHVYDKMAKMIRLTIATIGNVVKEYASGDRTIGGKV